VALETEEEIEAKKKAEQKIEELREEDDQKALDEEKIIKELKKDEEKFSFEEIEATLPEYLRGWNAVGLHRQVGGFWTLFFVLLILILPAAFFFLWLFPAVIFPSPSGQGFYSFAVSFFGALWILADFGTSVWMTREFAAQRIKSPEKAISSAQCFLWFQVLTGAFQIVLVGFIGAIGFPDTVYAHLTYVFIWYSLFQWLGFFMVFVNILNSLQRSDVAGVGVAVLAPLVVLFQIFLVPLFIWIGSQNPSIGMALGGAIGSSLANFATNVVLFLASWWIFKKTFGFSGTTIFRVDFDGEQFKDMLKFGYKYAIGQALVPLVWTLQVILLSIYLDNYNNWLGYWQIAFTVVQISVILAIFDASLIPAFSEAHENKKSDLLNYNIASSMKWNNNLNFWLSAAMFAILVPLVLMITPPEFHSVAMLIPLLVLFQMLGPYSWLGDAVFAGTNNPKLNTYMWTLEQGTRAILLFICVPLLAADPAIGMFSIMFAYIPAILIKDIACFIIIKKKIVPELKLYPFKTFIAPGLAGIVFYFITLLLVLMLGGNIIGLVIVVLFVFLIGPFIYFFFSGLFGGWSDNGLEEFNRSVTVMSVAGKYAKGMYTCCRVGANLSPWKEKGNIKIYNKARVEAWELTLLKKKLQTF